jgi:hypothetical protein
MIAGFERTGVSGPETILELRICRYASGAGALLEVSTRRDMRREPKGAEAQCAVCGELFSSDDAFDAHQKANYRAKRRENIVKCLDPRRGEERALLSRVR